MTRETTTATTTMTTTTDRERRAMRGRQLAAVVWLELGKNLRSWRGLWLYLLALLPVLPIGVHGLVTLFDASNAHPLDHDTTVLATIFQFYYLRLGIFFGCLGLFTRLFRGEIMEKSLHHYLLAPLRRELLTVGKFLAGFLISSGVFGVGVLLSTVAMYFHHGPEARAFLLGGPGLAHLGAYLAVTVLGCLGYGALFLLLGLLAKNPIIPAVLVLVWESLNHVLPASLKLWSVVFYLEPLLPVYVPPQEEGLLALFAIPADPVSPYVALPGLLLVTAVILAAACLRARRTEIIYAD